MQTKIIRNSKAFTLIELLVVVLIIGVLTAIAVPQYTRAVAKSRMSEAMTNIGPFFNAMEREYLSKGSYPTNLNELDLSMANMTPYGSVTEPTIYAYRAGDFLYGLMDYGSAIIMYPAQGQLQFFIERIGSKASSSRKSQNICTAYGQQETAYDDACKSMGGVGIGATDVNGTRKRWYVY